MVISHAREPFLFSAPPDYTIRSLNDEIGILVVLLYYLIDAAYVFIPEQLHIST